MRSVGVLIVATVAAAALTACAKSNSTSNAQASNAVASSTPVEAASSLASANVKSPGALVYLANCASCHQSNGKGLTGAFPPLAANPAVTGNPQHVIHIVKYGLTGKIMVGPDAFNGIMPPWGSQLSDDAIANVISYIRSSWGNKGNAVTAAEVTSVKK
ncbi:MAG: cytochrome c [Candidatus Eremiobacteraeota bacterium]|nr:cytochrome c [Candidatus Eremiobacteraeota bacterium]